MYRLMISEKSKKTSQVLIEKGILTTSTMSNAACSGASFLNSMYAG